MLNFLNIRGQGGWFSIFFLNFFSQKLNPLPRRGSKIYGTYIFNRVMSGEWGGSFQLHSNCITLKSQPIHAWHRCPYRANLSSKFSLIFSRISEIYSIYFLSLCFLRRKPMGILLYVKFHRILLFFGFQIFFVLHENPHLEILIFYYIILCIKNEIH